MAHDVQVAVDCARPHELADWWAEALGWEVEPQDEDFIRRMIEEGHASEEHTVRHRGALVWKSATALRSPDPGRPANALPGGARAEDGQEPAAPGRDVGADRREAEVARLVDLGATELWREAQGAYAWVTLADPEGNEFCIA